ncbi:class III signal peptide-containing protein [Halobacteriovorax sp. JY17]|uniref:Flp family type IVb pilin n=1 Tax=Halobacteriovorax sp. JY17 TaxID=2014617 RepID=UPI0025BCD56B|nr:class III signal peptide-containing protein [Halobacteriovorax sp. JY17]
MISLKSNKGQTSVEYIMLIAVMVTIMGSVLGTVRSAILGDARNCAPDSKAIVCSFERSFNVEDLRYFTIKR